MKDPSPLIRSSAAESLGLRPSADGVQALAAATGDPVHLVRVRAAAALAGIPGFTASEKDNPSVTRATEEYLASILARPDLWFSHYNLGNHHLGRQDHAAAVSAYQTAIRLDPTQVAPYVNLSMAYARGGAAAQARAALVHALSLEPDNPQANFNMGLLAAERNDPVVAESHLRRALRADPLMAPAAYNLCVLLGEERTSEALEFCRRAAALAPREARYARAYAYYRGILEGRQPGGPPEP
jgi:tetratricopeptide (TPR) repeat protein